VVAAAGQISATVQTPFLSLCDTSMGVSRLVFYLQRTPSNKLHHPQYHLPSCVRILQASYIVEILREVGAPGLHIKSVSEQSGASRKRSYDHKGIIELDSILGVLLGSPEITRNQGLRVSLSLPISEESV
jgi:hypothetical protein